jgi:rfaE bifunctional protein kinase chain/domain/rfaE bifunctional protein nucleotidyltransferase chain/domain
MIPLDNKKFLKKIKKLKSKNKKIVLCHGVFDLLHLGHINHFKSAKKFGDYLVVSITANKFVNKGPGRPVFNQQERLNFLQELKIIDETILSNSSSAENVIKTIKPDFYVKGPDYKNNINDKTKKIYLEKKIVEKYGGQIKYTNDDVFSSSNLINTNNFIFNEEQKKFILKLKKKFSYDKVYSEIQKIKKLKVIIIGELIIDNYCFGEIIGKSGKEPHLVLSQKKNEYYLGGTGAIVRHISSFVKNVNLVSPFGGEKIFRNLIKKKLDKNVKLNLIKPTKNYKTIQKTRFVDQISNYKLFGSYILPEKNIDNFENEVFNIFLKKKNDFDMVLICDYGHNFLTNIIVKKIKKFKKFISVNAQINAANIGYHTVEKYCGVDSIVINENELRQELRDKVSDVQILAKKLIMKNKIKYLIVTRGKNGVIMVDNKFNLTFCPAFAKNSVDKVGAGDAMLSVTSLCLKMNIDPELTLFLGSLAAANAVETIGNKTSISYEKIDRAVEYILK